MQPLLFERLRTSLFVMTERIPDIHKAVLRTGGLPEGPALAAVTGALEAVLGYQRTVLEAALHGVALHAGARKACSQALRELQGLVEQLVAEEHSRAAGLALHEVVSALRHMAWRMDSLAERLSQSTPT